MLQGPPLQFDNAVTAVVKRFIIAAVIIINILHTSRLPEIRCHGDR